MALEDIKVPDIGEYSDVDVIEVLVNVGDEVAEEDSLLTLETDKATMEVPSPSAGKIAEVLVKEGDKISEGSLIFKMEVGASADTSSDSAPEEPAKEEAAPAAEPEAASPGGVEDLIIPDIGEYSDVDVIEVSVKEGDEVQEEDPLITLETDKATMEVPSPVVGKIVALSVKEGDKVSQGTVIGQIQMAGSSAAPAAKAAPATKKEAPRKASPAPAPAAAESAAPESAGSANDYASPSVRRFARELGVELGKVPGGSGRKGRIMQEDVQKFVKSVMQGGGATSTGGGAGLGLIPDPVVDFAKFGEVESVPLTRIQKISGDNLHRNWVKVPHITFFEDADITECEKFRQAKKPHAEKLGVKVTPVAFILKAVAQALVEFPKMNSSLAADGQNLVMKKYINIGVAVDTPAGLMVPVIRDCANKGIYELAQDLMAMSLKARDGKLTAKDMQGGCFTISSLGNIGTQYFAPIVNMPEVGILGVSKSTTKPIWNGSEFVPRLMLPLSLSVDHRVIDGAYAGKFVVAVAKYLSDLKELVL